MRPRAPLALVAVLIACGGADGPAQAPAAVPTRVETAGDRLLARAPAGAEAVLEVDLARLRDNPAVGALVERFTAGDLEVGFDVVAEADALLVCAYGIAAGARQLVLVSGAGVGEQGGARLAPDVIALGPGDLVARAEALRGGHEPSLASEAALLGLRAEAMPERAPGASLRLTARLGFDARVELARRLDVGEVPVSVSVWGDVVDDLAIVAVLGAEDEVGAARLARGLMALRDRLSRTPAVRLLGLAPDLTRMRVEQRGAAVRVVFWIGPRRLEALVSGTLERLAPGAPSS